MPGDCERTRLALAEADGTERLVDQLAPAQRGHLSRCLRCQAEAVRERRTRRALAELAGDPAPAEPGVLAGVFAALDAYDARVARRAAALGRATVLVGGVAMATAGATVALWLTRGRRAHRLGLAG